MYKWEVTIEAWPYYSISQKEAGEPVQKYTVEGHEMRHALHAAELIQRGMKSNPAVWQAPIMSIVRKRD